MTIPNIIGVITLLAALMLVVVFKAPRRGRPRVTLLQRYIRALYHTGAWIEDLAIAIDRGYLNYLLERRLSTIDPENEKFGPGEEPA